MVFAPRPGGRHCGVQTDRIGSVGLHNLSSATAVAPYLLHRIRTPAACKPPPLTRITFIYSYQNNKQNIKRTVIQIKLIQTNQTCPQPKLHMRHRHRRRPRKTSEIVVQNRLYRQLHHFTCVVCTVSACTDRPVGCHSGVQTDRRPVVTVLYCELVPIYARVLRLRLCVCLLPPSPSLSTRPSDVFTYPAQLRLSVCPEPQPRDASHNPASSLCNLLLCRPLRNRLQRTLLHPLGH